MILRQEFCAVNEVVGDIQYLFPEFSKVRVCYQYRKCPSYSYDSDVINMPFNYSEITDVVPAGILILQRNLALRNLEFNPANVLRFMFFHELGHRHEVQRMLTHTKKPQVLYDMLDRMCKLHKKLSPEQYRSTPEEAQADKFALFYLKEYQVRHMTHLVSQVAKPQLLGR